MLLPLLRIYLMFQPLRIVLLLLLKLASWYYKHCCFKLSF